MAAALLILSIGIRYIYSSGMAATASSSCQLNLSGSIFWGQYSAIAQLQSFQLNLSGSILSGQVLGTIWLNVCQLNLVGSSLFGEYLATAQECFSQLNLSGPNLSGQYNTIAHPSLSQSNCSIPINTSLQMAGTEGGESKNLYPRHRSNNYDINALRIQHLFSAPSL